MGNPRPLHVVGGWSTPIHYRVFPFRAANDDRISRCRIITQKAAGTASGFTGWFAYFGAAFAGYPLGKVAQDWGWHGFFVALLACALIALLFFLPTWNASEQSLRKHSH